MKYILILVAFVLLLLMYWIFVTYHKISISEKLIAIAVPFSIASTDYTKTMLVLGDSTAVGVGASTSTDSVPALLAGYIGATYVENHGVSGAVATDLATQMSNLSRSHYDTILIQIGGNDITHFHDVRTVTTTLHTIITLLKKKSTEKSPRIILISAGNVGGAHAVPPPLRPYYTYLNLKYHASFEALAKKDAITYVNTYQDPRVDPFIQNPELYFAADSFHPSSLGYGVWFETIKKHISP